MLKPGWYLPTIDWFAQLRDAPQPVGDGQALIDQLHHTLRDDPSFGPAHTITATYAILTSVDYLREAMTHAARTHDLTDVARLVCGLNLITAHLTQTVQLIAEHTNNRAFDGVAHAHNDAIRALSDHLTAAGATGEILAAYLKEAHLTLRKRRTFTGSTATSRTQLPNPTGTTDGLPDGGPLLSGADT
ncbi:MAG TPA: hypothetical protein VF657_09010 [Actinoplanes sp.]|jgi:hypothetical protein